MRKLLEIMAALRDPQTGCPWDIKQSFKTIVPYTLEEAYEVADAIENDDMHELKSELGDLLFQVVFYAQMAKEQDDFDFDDVVEAVSEKLINRHPHVFGDVDRNGKNILNDTELNKIELNGAELNEAELNEAWEKSKAGERNNQAETKQNKKALILDGVAKALPALKRAQKLQKRAAREGFDWPNVEPVLAKIEEEIQELREAMQQKDQQHIIEETGDVLFSCVNLARHLNVDAEESLRRCNQKFEQRFGFIEQVLNDDNKSFKSCSLDDLEDLWEQAKISSTNVQVELYKLQIETGCWFV